MGEGRVHRTFVIADVRGYTRFTREHGDAAAARLASVFAELARDAVEARRGEVLELRGDEALSVFLDEAQAVRAALEFQAMCAEEFAADPTLPLNVGIGVDAGEAIPVQGGYRGKALNMAARLCSNAGAGQVFVSADVAAALRSAPDLAIHDRGDATLKGFDGAVRLIEVSDAREPVAEPAPPGSAALLPPELDVTIPLVGRDHEMRWLRGTWRQARRGRGRVVVLTGPSGIGKTRLAAELASHVEQRGGTVRYAGLGGTATATAGSAIADVVGATSPTLLVLDDLDAMGERVVQALDGAARAIETRPVMVVCTVGRRDGSPALASLIEELDVRGDGEFRVGPLDDEGVLGIVEQYVDPNATAVPLESFARSSGGNPGRAHEVVGAWAREEAARRLEAAADWIASARTRRAEDLAFANDVIGRGLHRLYVAQPVDPAVGDACPYKGLASFAGDDSSLFFGREALVGELAARTVRAGLLGVVGASGAGKSSVIAAGLVPSLRAGLLPGSERWGSVALRPGEHPMDALALATSGLADLGERAIVVVDQFEEVFTLCADERARAAFIDELAGLASDPDRVAVVLAIRGDHYGSCAPYPVLADLLATNNVLVGPMGRDELRRAIELPARRAGRRVEAALIDSLIEETADEPGGLPLLSTALVELWRRSTDGWLRLATHEQAGGVRGAVARLAEGSYAELTPAQRDVARVVFLRLVAASGEEVTSRRRVPMEEFDADRDPVTASVLARLTDDRLLTRGEDTIEIAHEALLREWPRLRSWIEDDAQGRQLRGHLTSAAKQWSSADRDPAELYRGARLSAALDWSTGHGAELNQLERSFLQESRQASEREADRQRRTNRRLKSLLVGVGVLLVIAVAAGVVARQRTAEAREQNTVADAQRIGALSATEQRADLALLLAAEGYRLAPTPETRADLTATVRRYGYMLSVTEPTGGRILRVVSSADGGVFAVNDQVGTLVLFDGATLAPLYPPITDLPFTDEMVFSRDGRTLFLAGWARPKDGSRMRLRALDVASGTVRWDVAIPASERGIDESAGGASNALMGLTPDGRYVTWAVAGPFDQDTQRLLPGTMHFYDASNGAERRHIVTPPGVDTYVLSRDRLLELSFGRVRIRDLGSDRVLRSFRGAFPLNGRSAVSPDGTEVATAGWNGTSDGVVSIVDLRTGEVRTMHGQHQGWIPALAWSPDGHTLASVDDDGSAFVWNAGTGDLKESLAGHASLLRGAAFVDAGRTLVTGGLDNQLIAWDMAGDRGYLRQARRPGPDCEDRCTFAHFGFTPDGTRLVTLDAPIDGGYRVRFLDPVTLRQVGILPPNVRDCCMKPAFSPDGTRLATLDMTTSSVWLVDAATGRKVRLLYRSDAKTISQFGDRGPVSDTVAFAPDGSLVATNENADVLLIDPSSGAVVARLPTDDYVEWVGFSHDSTRLLASSDDGNLKLFDLRTGRELWTVHLDDDVALGGSFSPDDVLAIAGSFSGRIHVIDVATGVERPQQRVLAHAAMVGSLSFSPDGSTYATTGIDGRTYLWDTATGRVLGPPLDIGENAAMSQFSPDGRSVYISTFRNIWVFDVAPDALIERACDVAGRTFTEAEWQRYLPDRPFDDPCA